MHFDIHVNTVGEIRVGIGPGLGGIQRIEFSHDQTAGEPGHTRVGRIDRRKRAGQQQTPLIAQLHEPFAVR